MSDPKPRRINLVCPYCGDEISAVLEDGGNYYTYQYATGFECDNAICGAEWDIHGSATLINGGFRD